MTQAAQLAQYGSNNVGLSFKNRIINGAMQIWQRGTPITTSGGYTADRWTQVSGNSIVHTQSTDAPTGFTNSMQMAGTGSNIAQRIESVNCIGLGGATVTVSLWYKNSTGSDPLSLSLYYANSADSFGSVTQIGSNQTLAASPSSSWTYYTVTFTNISANAINGLALYVFRGSSATATGLLTGVQLEVGSVATSFDYLPYGTGLMLCQRYYYKATTGTLFNQLAFCNIRTTTSHYAFLQLPVTLRANPSSVDYGGLGVIAAWGAGVTGLNSLTLANAAYGAGTTQVLLDAVTTGAVGTVGQISFLLGNNSTTGFVALNAEL
jgi:hypothetical protein